MQTKIQPDVAAQQQYWPTSNPVADVAGLFGSGSNDPTDPFTLYGIVRCVPCDLGTQVRDIPE
jgi:hypothetical protein